MAATLLPGLPPDGHPDCPKALVKLFLSDSSNGIDGVGPLAFAASHGFCKSLADIAKISGESVSDTDEFGRTALHNCVIGDLDSPQTVEALVSLGADPLFVDEEGRTPLHHAANFNLPLACQALLRAAPAAASASDIRLATPLILAACAGSSLAVNVLIPRSDPKARSKYGRDAFFEAARQSPETLEPLIPFADPDNVDDKLRTPLHQAVLSWEGALNIPLLVSLGFDPLRPDMHGKSPVLMAIDNQNDRAFLALLPLFDPALFPGGASAIRDLLARCIPSLVGTFDSSIASRRHSSELESSTATRHSRPTGKPGAGRAL